MAALVLPAAPLLLPPPPPMRIPVHLSLTTSEAAGRSLTVTTFQAAGEQVLVDEPFCHVIHQRFRRFTCDSCYAFVSVDGADLMFPCEEECGIHYCSAECRASKKVRHASVCGRTNLGSKSKTSRRRAGKAIETGVNLLLSAISNPAPLSTLAHQLSEDEASAATPGKAKRLSTYASTEASLRSLLACPLPPGSYAAALSSAHFNAIGLYDEYGDESGYVLAPIMALVNHR